MRFLKTGTGKVKMTEPMKCESENKAEYVTAMLSTV
jgi:hypothetical protein